MKHIVSIQSIIIRPARKAEPVHVDNVKITQTGVEGDHYAKAEGNRQVTIIAADGLARVAAITGFQGDVHLASRRNIMVDTIPGNDLKGKIIQLGDEVVIEITGYCTPCFRMEENFGKGAIEAFSKHAGWVARVIKTGSISVGDKFLMK